jgi:hypothetical protein
MYMVYHGDHEDMVFDNPKCFDDREEAIAYAEAKLKKGIPKGHALTLYDCSERRIWEATETAS